MAQGYHGELSLPDEGRPRRTLLASTSCSSASMSGAADVGGNPSYEASLGDICDLRFQLLEGGSISDNMLPVRCRCQLEGRWVDGDAMVTGDFTDSQLRFQVDVTLPRSEYTGGCTHSFEASRP